LEYKDKNADPKNGEELIARMENVHLGKQWVQADKQNLGAPIPDVLYRYGTMTYLNDRFPTVSTREEESDLSEFRIAGSLLIPFLSSQWQTDHGDMEAAKRQTARDGVAINNFLRRLFKAAGIEPTHEDTCHWSRTVNSEGATLWLHWIEAGTGNGSCRYHMKGMLDARFAGRGEDEVGQGLSLMRQYLKNLLTNAQTRPGHSYARSSGRYQEEGRVENPWLGRTVPTWSMGQAAQGWGSKPMAERVLVEVVLATKMFWTRVWGKRLVEEVERALESSARVRSPGAGQL
jgi:hypothetical protein